ncbi:uncharacterized protein LOC134214699 [Armigeres subalbatus]|uniref:uncharacterized protein LOC134214699 n=1 Tax=Armigeres subalbatus TaxID=124917 RepID=UPI002ED00198
MRIVASRGGTWIIALLGYILGWAAGQISENPCVPRCVTFGEINTLWMTKSVRQYWQCEPVDENDWNIRLKTCASGTVFDYEKQTCVTEDLTKEYSSVCVERDPSIVIPPEQDEWLELCPEPGCSNFQEINTLWAIPDPAFFLQCRPDPSGIWVLHQMPCAPTKLFHFARQVCVLPNNWLACDGQVIGTTTTQATTTTEVSPTFPDDVTDEEISTTTTQIVTTTTPTQEVTTTTPQVVTTTTTQEVTTTTTAAATTTTTAPVTTTTTQEVTTTTAAPVTTTTTQEVTTTTTAPVTTTTTQEVTTTTTTPVTTTTTQEVTTTTAAPVTTTTTQEVTTTTAAPVTTTTTQEATTTTPTQAVTTTTPQVVTTTTTQGLTGTTPVPDDETDFCIEPRCQTTAEINTLWPNPNNTFFYQCRPAFGGGWTPQLMPCAPGTVFSFPHQVCVWPAQWTDPCGSIGSTTVDGDDLLTTTPDGGSTATTEDVSTTIPTEGPTTTPENGTSTTTEGSTTTPENGTSTTTGEVTLPDEGLTNTTTTPENGVSTTPDGGTTPGHIVDCLIPNCVYLQNEEIRWPTRVPEEFYRCIFLLDTIWIPFLDRCPQGTYFSFEQQYCIDPAYWNDICADVPEGITTTQMTTTTEETGNEIESPLPVICGSPRCSTASERSILWPSTVANQFYECLWVERLFQYVPFPRRCSSYLLFDFQKQDCVQPLEWVDICPIFPTLPPSCPECCPTCPPTTDEPTTSEYPDWMPIPVICGTPRCTTDLERSFMWPADDARNFYICVDTGNDWWQTTLLECEEGQYFQTMLQTCVPEQEYDATFCPIFPPPPAAPTVVPSDPVETCLEGYNSSNIQPVTCDDPRCITSYEVSAYWPSVDPSKYYECELQLSGGYAPSVRDCPQNTQFDFFRQCCTLVPVLTAEEVCALFDGLAPTSTPDPSTDGSPILTPPSWG